MCKRQKVARLLYVCRRYHNQLALTFRDHISLIIFVRLHLKYACTFGTHIIIYIQKMKYTLIRSLYIIMYIKYNLKDETMVADWSDETYFSR